MTVRIMSWNVNGIRATFSKDSTSSQSLERFLKEQELDILCIQETKVSDWSKLSKELVSIKGFDSFWSFSKKRKGWSGVATFARQGSTVAAHEGFLQPNFHDEGRCVMTDHGSFILFNVYFPNAGRGQDRLDYKLQFYDAFKQTCADLISKGKSVIVTGDVNTAHTAMDVYDATSYTDFTGFLPIEREWITQFLNVGFIDVFRYLHPKTSNAFTFWDMRTSLFLPFFALIPKPIVKRANNQGWRIDYFFVSNELKSLILECIHLTQMMGSDHCPLVLTLGLSLDTTFKTPKMAGNLRKEFLSSMKPLTNYFKKLNSKGCNAIQESSKPTE